MIDVSFIIILTRVKIFSSYNVPFAITLIAKEVVFILAIEGCWLFAVLTVFDLVFSHRERNGDTTMNLECHFV